MNDQQPDYTSQQRAAQTFKPLEDRYRDRFQRIGLLVIPVRPGGKEPLCRGWTERPPGDQWRESRDRGVKYPNYGLVPGNGWIFFDPDSERGRVALDHELTRLGVSIARVQSATPGHGHLYARIKDLPAGLQSKFELAPDYGPGDVRVGLGSFVVAPPSKVNGNRYRFERRNTPEKVISGRALTWEGLARFLRDGGRVLYAPVTELPVSFPYNPEIPQWIAYGLKLLAGWHKPSGPERAGLRVTLPATGEKREYSSRSEAEQAFITGLIGRGWGFDQIHDLFEDTQPGHYAELKTPRRRGEYLETSYNNAINYVASAGVRPLVAAWLADAQTRPWPGRTGELDRRVFIALLTVAWVHNTTAPYASIREIMRLAGASLAGVQNAIKRLISDGWITPEGKHQGTNVYRIDGSQWATADPGKWERSVIAVKPGPERRIDDLPGGGELWTAGKLGRTAGTVYAILSDTPQRVTAIARRIGKHHATVSRALARLADHGLAAGDGDGWRVGRGDPAAVAHEYRAQQDGAARTRAIRRQQTAYREQRHNWARGRGKGRS